MQQQSTSLCDTKYKIVFLGNMGVGKTSIIQRFVKDQFDPFNNVPIPQLQPTVGIDFLTRNISFQSNSLIFILQYRDKTYRLQLWDTAGQEKYKSLVPAYLRDANCAVFIFDFSRKDSFCDIPNWIQLYRDHASEMSVGFIMEGNKCDLIDEKSKEIKQSSEPYIDLEHEAREFARKENMIFRKVSAKTGKDIVSSFRNIISELQSGTKNTINSQEQDPQTKFQNEVLEKIDKLKLQDIKKGQTTNCCYI